MTSEQIGKVIGITVGAVITILLTGLLVGTLFAFPIMWVWNYMMPDIFGLPEITFWQAFWGSFMVRLVTASGTTK